ncbi:MAG: nicotinate phosphoribosyltransferase, partial [Candidatus Thorarchaeota archaeon]
AARGSYIAGFDGTSNVIADIELGINSSGTMAHSFVQRFDNEMESFETYYKLYGKDSILLIDTYDTERAAKSICKYKNTIKAVRIDSGDLIEHSKNVRKILDENGCEKVLIVASSDLNEYKIKNLLDNNAPVDAFGIGTELATSRDDPSLAVVYKLMEYQGKPKIKTSEKKITFPGEKQIYRTYNKNGLFKEDILMLEGETPPSNSEALLIPIMKKGILNCQIPSLNEIKQYYLKNIEKLPNEFKDLDKNEDYKVKISNKLNDLINSLRKQYS